MKERMSELLKIMYWFLLLLLCCYLLVTTTKEIQIPDWVTPFAFLLPSIGLWITEYKYQELLDETNKN